MSDSDSNNITLELSYPVSVWHGEQIVNLTKYRGNNTWDGFDEDGQPQRFTDLEPIKVVLDISEQEAADLDKDRITADHIDRFAADIYNKVLTANRQLAEIDGKYLYITDYWQRISNRVMFALKAKMAEESSELRRLPGY
jgi:hypothetical protein